MPLEAAAGATLTASDPVPQDGKLTPSDVFAKGSHQPIIEVPAARGRSTRWHSLVVMGWCTALSASVATTESSGVHLS